MRAVCPSDGQDLNPESVISLESLLVVEVGGQTQRGLPGAAGREFCSTLWAVVWRPL